LHLLEIARSFLKFTSCQSCKQSILHSVTANIVCLFKLLKSSSISLKFYHKNPIRKAKRDLDRIKIEAEQKVATAQAEARALALQREAITSNLIKLRVTRRSGLLSENGTAIFRRP
jgi:hypothetical protein